MAEIVNIKDKNDDIKYPITKATATYRADNTTQVETSLAQAAYISDGTTPSPIQNTPVYPISDSITIRGTGNDVVLANGAIIPFTGVANSIGTGLSRENNGVRIGKGVTKVLVSANIFFAGNNNTAYGWAELYKNNAAVVNTIACTTVSSFGSAVLSPFLLDVAEGDLLQFKNLSNSPLFRGAQSFMTVSAIKETVGETLPLPSGPDVTTDRIVDKAVTSDKLNFSTFANGVYLGENLSNPVVINQSQTTDLATLTAPSSGKYLVLANAYTQFNNVYIGDLSQRLLKNTSEISFGSDSFSTGTTQGNMSKNLITVADLSAGDVVRYRIWCGQSNGTARHISLAFIRIGD